MTPTSNVLADTSAAWLRAVVVCAVTFLVVCPTIGAAQTSLGLQLSEAIGSRPQASTAQAEYLIGPDDVVTVTVYQEPDLSIENAKVGPDGTISMPLLGNLTVSGLSSRQLHALVTQRLADGYLKQPNVTVKVDRQQLYYIKGEVAAPGGYVLVDGLTVEKAIALAGGYTERAAKSDVTIVREGPSGDGLREAPVSTPIRAGDVITIEESFF
ncbi:MAG: protein involved in polysaccharide export with SLBB domain [Gammaproteobacteria bacterium]